MCWACQSAVASCQVAAERRDLSSRSAVFCITTLHREVQLPLETREALSPVTWLPGHMSRHARCGVQEAKGSPWTPPLRPQPNESCVRSLQVGNATACIVVVSNLFCEHSPCTCDACTAMAAR